MKMQSKPAHRWLMLSCLLALVPLMSSAASWKVSLPVQGSVSQALSPDGQQVGMASTFGPALFFAVEDGRIKESRTRPTERAYSFAWQPDGKGFYYGDPDARDGKQVQGVGPKGAGLPVLGGPHQVVPSPGGRWMASVDYTHLRLVDLRDGRLNTLLETLLKAGDSPIGDVSLLAWASDDILLVIYSSNGDAGPLVVCAFDVAHAKIVSTTVAPRHGKASALALDRTGHRLWIGTDEGHVLGLDLRTKKIDVETALEKTPINALAVSQAGHLAAWVEDRIVLADVHAPKLPSRSIQAWSTMGAVAERPLLAWSGEDLLLAAGAGGGAGQWWAERRDNVWEALNQTPEARAKRFAETQALADKGDTAAQLLLGQMFFEGVGVEKDETKAIGWWKKSANAGQLDAQFALADAYSKGLGGLERDREKSVYWWSKAADQLRVKSDSGDRPAAARLGYMHAKGMGVHPDPMLADLLLRIGSGDPAQVERDAHAALIERVERDLAPVQIKQVAGLLASWKPGVILPRDLREAVCAVPAHPQKGFDRTLGLAQFRDFQGRLRSDLDAFSNSNDIPGDETAVLAALRHVFRNSMAGGRKADSLMQSLMRPPPRNIVSPMRMLLADLKGKACPVGFGGKFVDDGQEVELWYVELDPSDEGAMAAFTPARLPQLGVNERNVFPTVLFVRDENNKLKWYGMSKEMDHILNYWFNIQVQ